MISFAYRLEIELQEATFFSSHELHDHYFTEALIGNYALAYALSLVKSPYDRTHVGYAEDLPTLNERGIYITPAWVLGKAKYRIERFNCQSESFFKGMIPNAVVELAGRQYLKQESKNAWKYVKDGKVGKKIPATNRPQSGILKLLSPQNRFECCLTTQEEIPLPRYIRLGKFMSKAKVSYRKRALRKKKDLQTVYKLVNPIDLEPESRILFGDTVNIHPVPLIRQAEIRGRWWTDEAGEPVCPADMKFRGM